MSRKQGTRRPKVDPHYWDCASPDCEKKARYRIHNKPVCADHFQQWSTRHFRKLT